MNLLFQSGPRGEEEKQYQFTQVSEFPDRKLTWKEGEEKPKTCCGGSGRDFGIRGRKLFRHILLPTSSAE